MTPKRSVYSYIHCSQIPQLREITKDLFYIYLQIICPCSCAQSPGSQSQCMNDVSIHLQDLWRATPILTLNSVAEVSCKMSAASAYSGKELLVGKLSRRKVIWNDFYTCVCVGGDYAGAWLFASLLGFWEAEVRAHCHWMNSILGPIISLHYCRVAQ